MQHALHVIGTAGHVDHGKSTLVKALTGIDPDRLAEEKAREMTIDLGFAWLTINDEEIGIVDVPGHRDFIENMLAGVGSIDLALLVVAADEGVMPQTLEHLAILDLLQIENGIVALTKVDLVDDADWLELVTLEVGETLAGTAMADAPILPVSAFTGQGLPELKQVLAHELARQGPRPDHGRPRLPIDRVFTLPGFGTVVTGTLSGGSLNLGDQVEVVPGALNARVRGLQTHKRKIERALPGSRVAVNLSGIDYNQVSRGQVVAAPGVLDSSILVDARYRHIPPSEDPLKHNSEVKLFVGSAEVVARARVIGDEVINAGQEGWLQLALSESLALSRGDRFILRRPSPPMTLGGGTILDPHPGRRHRRFREDVRRRFETLSAGTPEEILLFALQRKEPLSRRDLLQQSQVDRALAEEALDNMVAQNAVRRFNELLITAGGWNALNASAQSILATFHERNPLRLGMPREELRSRLKLVPTLFSALVDEAVAAGAIIDEGPVIRLAAHHIRFSPAQSKAIDDWLQAVVGSGANTPSVKDGKRDVGDDLFQALLDLGRIRQLNKDVFYEAAQLDRIAARVADHIRDAGQIDAAQTRDILQTSRKYAIAILEYLDATKVTRRVGDVRVLA